MKKITKGAIAAGAAALLLVGGGGTFMSWNDDIVMEENGINAGTLSLEAAEEGQWSLNGGPEFEDVSTVTIVPGDVLEFTQSVTINATGDNIQGTLTLQDGSITGAGGPDSADAQLATALTEGATYSVASTSDGLTGTDGVLSFSGDGTYEADLSVVLDFDFDSVGGQEAQNGTVDLSGVGLVLQQTDASQV